jgi:hypothetical protein
MSETARHTGLPLPETLTIELSKSITLGGGGDDTVYTEIVLCEPTLDQLSQFIRKTQKESAIDSMRFLIGLVSGIPLPVLNKIGVRDFYKAQDYLIKFITPPDEDDPQGNAAGSHSVGS